MLGIPVVNIMQVAMTNPIQQGLKPFVIMTWL